MTGFALGVLLTLCVQLAVRWAARYRWARELLQALDLRLLDPVSGPSGGAAVGGGSGGTSASSASAASSSSSRDGSVVGLEASVARFLGLVVRRLQRLWNGTLGAGGRFGERSFGDARRAPTAGRGVGVTAEAEGARALSGSSASTSEASQARSGNASSSSSSAADLADAGEAVEWVNMCWRKVRGELGEKQR